MKKFILFILSFCLLTPVVMTAQSKVEVKVSGKVVDGNGESVPFATVYVKDFPGRGAMTDDNGKFSFKVPQNSTIVAKMMGYKDAVQFISKATSKVKLVLKEDTEKLDEVIVTGLQSQKKVSVVGAISTIDVAEIKSPGSSLTNMLGGRMAGVITMTSSGEPGKNLSNFWIRGISTFGAGSGALVLIDGLEGNLNDIDPDDVQSFSILKDASATAVYGVRGADGVVIVTTKRGNKDKLNITARATTKLSIIKRLPQYLGSYDYALLANEARAMSGENDLYSELDLNLIRSGLDRDLFPNVNWMDKIMKGHSLQQNYFMSARGGGNIATYYLSLGFQDEGAAYRQEENLFKKPLSYKRMTYRANIDMFLTQKTKLYFGVDGNIARYTTPGGANTNRIWNAVSVLNPLMFPFEYSDGTFPTYGRDDLISPYVMLNHTGYSESENNRNLLTLKLTQSFGGVLEGLTVAAQGMYEHRGNFNESRIVAPDLYLATGRTADGTLIKTLRAKRRDMAYSSGVNTFRKYYFESKANWSRTFGKHNVGALLFYYLEDTHGSNWGGGDRLGISAIPRRRQNVSGRVNYGYNNTYFVDANFGYTGSAQFKTGEQYGLFPSMALGWVPTGYKWVQDNMSWLNFFKIRASYGLAGNDRITGRRFPYLTLINNHAPTYWGHSGQGIKEYQTGADNLKWELATKANLGIDLKLLNDNLSVTVDVFNDQRDNIFQERRTLPKYVGMVTFPFSNVGRMHSYGSDGNISYHYKINKDQNITFRGNYTFSQNIVDYFEEPKLPYEYQSVSNKPHGIIRGYISEGLFSSQDEIRTSPDQSGAFGKVRPGDIKYRDVNGDGVINKDDRVPLSYGNQVPRVMYGFGATYNWKDLSIGFLFKGSAKVEYYRSGMGNDEGWIPFFNGDRGNVLKIANNPKNRWTPAWYSGTEATENPNALYPRLSYGGNSNNSQLSTFWKRDGSFLRFQELSVRYKLHKMNWLKKTGLSSIDLELVANNLFTIDKVKFFDPEQASQNGRAYPIPMTFAFQAYLKF